jgi:hypothetical protein
MEKRAMIQWRCEISPIQNVEDIDTKLQIEALRLRPYEIVFEECNVGWNDLGDPERVISTLLDRDHSPLGRTDGANSPPRQAFRWRRLLLEAASSPPTNPLGIPDLGQVSIPYFLDLA